MRNILMSIMDMLHPVLTGIGFLLVAVSLFATGVQFSIEWDRWMRDRKERKERKEQERRSR